MSYLARLMVLALITPAQPTGLKSLVFTAEQVNAVMYSFERDHYCSPYPVAGAPTGAERYIGDAPGPQKAPLRGVPLHVAHAALAKQGLTEMWAPDAASCDLRKQQSAFYDSVWRDAVRLEAVINYKIYFGPALAGKVHLDDYAIDDGVVAPEMMKLLTTDTTDTFGAQNDDIMWWALAYLRGYEYDRSHREYLHAAEAVFRRIEHSPEQEVCGGGVTWGEGTHYKNAITNTLYLALAARLANLTPEHSEDRRRYIAAAVQEADWLMDRSGLWVAGGLLGDGLHFKAQACSDLEPTVWTYSQGVALSGLAQLTLLTGDTRYADRAQKLLLRVLDSAQTPRMVSPSGILDEPSALPATANEDAQTFKGIFVENLGYALPYFRQADRHRYARAISVGRSFLIANANAVWGLRQQRGRSVEFPYDWTGSESGLRSGDEGNVRTTAAAIELFNAAWSARSPD